MLVDEKFQYLKKLLSIRWERFCNDVNNDGQDDLLSHPPSLEQPCLLPLLAIDIKKKQTLQQFIYVLCPESN